MEFLFRNKETGEQKLIDIYQEKVPPAKYGPENKKWRDDLKRWNKKEFNRKAKELEAKGWIR